MNEEKQQRKEHFFFPIVNLKISKSTPTLVI